MNDIQPIGGLATSTTLREFAQAVKEKTLGLGRRQAEMVIGEVSGEGLKKAQQALQDNGRLNINLSGFQHVIVSDDITHAFSQHGDLEKEKAKGQIPITQEDFVRVPEVLSNPDRVTLSAEKTAKGLDAFIFEKRVDSTIFVVEEVRTGQNTLAFRTMYKKPAPKK